MVQLGVGENGEVGGEGKKNGRNEGNMQSFLAKGIGEMEQSDIIHLLTTPCKRKASIVVDEPCQTQNCESPAKRSRNKFSSNFGMVVGREEVKRKLGKFCIQPQI